MTPAADILRSWDCRYDPASIGATLFERFYRGLIREVFGGVCGAEVMRHVTGETSILADFYYNLDRILLADTSVWFGDESRDADLRPRRSPARSTVRSPRGEASSA